MAEVPYYLKASIENAPSSNEIFSLGSITTAVPSGINWDIPTEGSEWTFENFKDGVGSVAKSVVDTALIVPKTLFGEGSTVAKDFLSGATDAVSSSADTLLWTVMKYVLIVGGVLILAIYVAGKSGAVSLKSVM